MKIWRFLPRTNGPFGFFISTLCVRNPRVHHFLKEQILAERKLFLRKFASDRTAFTNLILELEPTISDSEIEETRKAISPSLESQFTSNIPDNDQNKSYIRSLLASTPLRDFGAKAILL